MLPDVNILVLDPPSEVTATPVSTSAIQLTWGAVPDATSYNIYRSLTENGTYTLLTNVTTTTYTDTGLIQNTTYYYRVEGINATETGTPSAPVDATTDAIEAPDTVTINETTPTSVTLSWTAVTGADGYNIYRATIATGPYTFINTTTGTTYTDTGLMPNTTYFYQITTLQDNVEGETSDPIEAITEALPAPITPTGLTATPQSPTTILLNWTPVTGASYYNVYRSTTANGPFTEVGTTTTPTFLDTNLTPATTYYYQVSATNANGTSSNSATASATTLVQQVGAPVLTATAISDKAISLTWTPVTGATTYLVFRSISIAGPFSIIATTTNTNYIDNNLASNTTYYYRITPYINTTPGTPSNIASATTQQQNNNNNCCCRCNRCCCNTYSYCNFCNNFNQCCCNRCCRRNWLFGW